jgi:hypothetical protein
MPDLARRVAKVDATVLITGESGVDKERIARLVHVESTRAAGPFIAVNCGAITETLLESELFGHTRGAFTGAASDRPGLFHAAHRGTSLLDEIGENSPTHRELERRSPAGGRSGHSGSEFLEKDASRHGAYSVGMSATWALSQERKSWRLRFS